MPARRHALTAAAFAALLSACHESPFPADASSVYDLSCAGNTRPTSATPNIYVYGTVKEVFSDPTRGGSPGLRTVQGAMLEACMVGVDPCTVDGSATSMADGTFAMGPHPTGSVPYDGYLYITNTGDRTAYLFPNAPLAEDQHDVNVTLMLNAFVAQLSALGIAVDQNKSIVGLQVLDCAGTPIGDSKNLKLEVQQNGSDVNNLNFIDANPFGDAFAGDTFVINVPPGMIDIGASYQGTELHRHTIMTVAGTMTETQIRPGY